MASLLNSNTSQTAIKKMKAEETFLNSTLDQHCPDFKTRQRYLKKKENRYPLWTQAQKPSKINEQTKATTYKTDCGPWPSGIDCLPRIARFQRMKTNQCNTLQINKGQNSHGYLNRCRKNMTKSNSFMTEILNKPGEKEDFLNLTKGHQWKSFK